MRISFKVATALMLCNAAPCFAIQQTNDNSPVTTATQQLHAAVLQKLPFSNTEDFAEAQKGFIAKPDSLIIKDKNGNVVWNMDQFTSFISLNSPAPATVNPALWRQAQLNSLYGLFKVTDHVYQVRGYDLAVMSIIVGKTGYIVVDPLTSRETSAAAMKLVYQNLGKKPIVAVIYTHSHMDHFGGAKGVISTVEVKNKKIPIIAPKGFMKEAISENVIAGNAMMRRAEYMYGKTLPANAQGLVDTGIGKSISLGTPGLIVPNKIIDKTGKTLTLDGVKFIFQFTPSTEAPAEMNFYLPQYQALCLAENAVHTMHNLYSLRGAKVRSAENWVNYLSQTLNLFGNKAQVVFSSHTWPVWGKANIEAYMENQRDMYKYIHDQTLHLANQGYTMNEIAEQLTLPPELAKQWYNQGFYGSISQNVKAVYQMYLGWYSDNPAELNPSPNELAAPKIIAYMGGSQVILDKAQQDFNQGNYRWVAQVLNNVVMAEPNNQQAKDLLAKTYEQLGYQTENSTWRNIYLTGALELRQGTKDARQTHEFSPDMIEAMTPDMLFNAMAIGLNAQKALGKKIIINIHLTDPTENYVLTLNHSVLNTAAQSTSQQTDASLTLSKPTLDKILLGQLKLDDAVSSGQLKLRGNLMQFKALLSMMDKFSPAFNIVTP